MLNQAATSNVTPCASGSKQSPVCGVSARLLTWKGESEFSALSRNSVFSQRACAPAKVDSCQLILIYGLLSFHILSAKRGKLPDSSARANAPLQRAEAFPGLLHLTPHQTSRPAPAAARHHNSPCSWRAAYRPSSCRTPPRVRHRFPFHRRRLRRFLHLMARC